MAHLKQVILKAASSPHQGPLKSTILKCSQYVMGAIIVFSKSHWELPGMLHFSLSLSPGLWSVFTQERSWNGPKSRKGKEFTQKWPNPAEAGEMGLKLCLRCCCHFIQFYSILLCIVESILKENLNLLKTYSFSGHPRCRCVFFFTCSAMNPLQWMGAVRIRIQTADKNIIIVFN